MRFFFCQERRLGPSSFLGTAQKEEDEEEASEMDDEEQDEEQVDMGKLRRYYTKET